jgi:hypothetical protein
VQAALCLPKTWKTTESKFQHAMPALLAKTHRGSYFPSLYFSGCLPIRVFLSGGLQL